jgi:DNA processing protein
LKKICDEKIIKYLVLNQMQGIGPVTQNAMLDIDGGIDRCFSAEPSELFSGDILRHIGKKRMCSFISQRKDVTLWNRAESILSASVNAGINVIIRDDDRFPRRFHGLPDTPILLYAKGNFRINDFAESVGIVGARRCSREGKERSIELAANAVENGAAVISGMAKGIDSYSHTAVIKSGGYTIAVLGNGVDICYPKEHGKLYEKIVEDGCVLSEFPPGTTPAKYTFPMRNRLIAALSDAVCVMEGSEQSGSLITAEDALKQKKALYTVPGSIFARESAGSNFLLKVGAKPCLSAYDLIEDHRAKYPYLSGALSLFGKPEKAPKKEAKPNLKKKIRSYIFPGAGRSDEEKIIPREYEFISISDSPIPEREKGEEKETKEAKSVLVMDLSEEERQVYSALGYEPISADALVDETLSAATVLRVLTKLEIKGLVQKVPGGKYVLLDRAEV